MFKFHLRQSLTYNLPPKLYDEVRPLELQKRSQKKQRIFPEKEPPTHSTCDIATLRVQALTAVGAKGSPVIGDLSREATQSSGCLPQWYKLGSKFLRPSSLPIHVENCPLISKSLAYLYIPFHYWFSVLGFCVYLAFIWTKWWQNVILNLTKASTHLHCLYSIPDPSSQINGDLPIPGYLAVNGLCWKSDGNLHPTSIHIFIFSKRAILWPTLICCYLSIKTESISGKLTWLMFHADQMPWQGDEIFWLKTNAGWSGKCSESVGHHLPLVSCQNGSSPSLPTLLIFKKQHDSDKTSCLPNPCTCSKLILSKWATTKHIQATKPTPTQPHFLHFSRGTCWLSG